MQIVNLKLINFRNYDHLEINFSDKINLIYGLNGVGKTNLVEAIYVLALTKSFRGTSDKILIKNGKPQARISGNILNEYTNAYQIIVTPEGKATKINKTKIKKLSDYISKINVILFNPDDLRIIKETPNLRRKFLNMDIAQLDNNYLVTLNLYNKILKQRNAYLKKGTNNNISLDYLNILTDKLITYGQIISTKRSIFLEQVNLEIKKIYNKITGNSDINIKYISDYQNLDKESIKEIYVKNIQKDLLFGKTNFGIHYDDFLITLNEKNIKDYGSEGQQKNAIIAYKLSEISLFKKIKKKNPILILDDLFSELDNEKINNILSLIEGDIQTFITTTDISHIDAKIRQKAKKFWIKDGKIMEE